MCDFDGDKWLLGRVCPSSKKEKDQDVKYKERTQTPEEIEKEKEEIAKLLKELDEIGKEQK